MVERTLAIPETLEAIDADRLTAALSQKAPGLQVALQRFGVDTTLDESLYYYKLWLTQCFYQFFFNSSYFQTEAFNTLHSSRFAIAALDHSVVELFRGVQI